jgi:hypothetical protein
MCEAYVNHGCLINLAADFEADEVISHNASLPLP